MKKHQEVHWVPPSRRVDLPNGKPKRVWTLTDGISDPQFKATLPIQPRHLQNAFLEDHIHDWSMHGGTLRYYSRVALHSVWILIEYEFEDR